MQGRVGRGGHMYRSRAYARRAVPQLVLDLVHAERQEPRHRLFGLRSRQAGDQLAKRPHSISFGV